MKKLLLGIISAVLISGIFVTSIAVAEENKIPNWIKTTAGFWVDEKISDDEFISALQFLINKGILNVPSSDVVDTTPTPAPAFAPEWITFGVNWYDEKIEIAIGFETDSDRQIAVDGVANLKIINDAISVIKKI